MIIIDLQILGKLSAFLRVLCKWTTYLCFCGSLEVVYWLISLACPFLCVYIYIYALKWCTQQGGNDDWWHHTILKVMVARQLDGMNATAAALCPYEGFYSNKKRGRYIYREREEVCLFDQSMVNLSLPSYCISVMCFYFLELLFY